MAESKTKKSAKSKKAKQPGFEDNLERLEEIVRLMEEESPPLDQMLSLFEEGVGLSASCRKVLDEAQGKVEQLLETAKGLVTEPFDEPEE